MQQIYYCPSCKAKIIFGTTICPECGTPFNWQQFKPPAQSTPNPEHTKLIPPNCQQNAPTWYLSKHPNFQEQSNFQQPNKKGIWLGLIGLLCFAGLIIFGVILWTLVVDRSPSTSSQVITSPPSPTTKSVVTTIAPSPGAVMITAVQLYSEYDTDQVAANAKYRDKSINVNGIINDIGKDSMGIPYVVLTSGGPYELFGVQCLFSAKDELKLAQLWVGQSLTVQGICQGFWLDVILRDCSIK